MEIRTPSQNLWELLLSFMRKIAWFLKDHFPQPILTCALFLKKLWDSDMLYRICFEYCVPIVSHFWWKLVCWELFEVSGSSHCPIDLTGQWLLPKTLNSSQQTNFCQKWLKIGTQYSRHILYNISESHNFFKKSAHVIK